eukprot:sb/3470943/
MMTPDHLLMASGLPGKNNICTPEQFTADEVEEYRDAFSVFDTDNDGIITTKELGTLLRYCIPLCPVSVYVTISPVSVQLLSCLTIPVHPFTRSLGQNPTETEVTDIINRVDANKNGVLEFREFVAMMASRITKESMESELRAAFKVFDRDGDGYISAEEFRTLMTSSGDRLTMDEVRDITRDEGGGPLTRVDVI